MVAYIWVWFFLEKSLGQSNLMHGPMICVTLSLQVIAAAQAGKHNEKRESYGDSLIIDPWGTVVGRLPGKLITLF